MTSTGTFDGGSQTHLRPVTPSTDRARAEQAARHRAAALTVATRATGVDDCAELLAMLGLHPTEGLGRG